MIVFDSLMADERTPAINTGARGLVQGPVEVRTGRRDLHSGLYGGAVLNATHMLMGILQEVLPGPDGRVREELRAGVASPSAEERESWARLPSGAEMIAEAGAAEVTAGAADEFWERTGAEPALDVNMLASGEPRTVIPSVARAQVSVRLAPGQSAEQIGAELERLLRAAAPAGVEVSIDARPVRSSPVRCARAGAPAGRRSVRARVRHAARLRAAGRNPAAPRGARRAGHADDRERLRPGRGRVSRAKRELPAREPPARRAHGTRAVSLAGRPPALSAG